MSTKPVSEEERAAILDSVKLMMRILSNFNHGRGVDSGAQHGYDEDVSGMVTDTSLSADTGTPTRVTGSIRSAREVQQEVTQPQERSMSPDILSRLLNVPIELPFEGQHGGIGGGSDAPGMDFDPMTLFLPELFEKLSDSIIYAPDEEAEARIIEAFTILLNLSKRMKDEFAVSFLDEDVLQGIIDKLSQ